ncbi:DUF397 domain-containing protein [Peterkaempfera bronchialis]|uniref:DUF397 domain-containing protein n=1 Tax=Peterkaempfera bronchialis TaxID=2126346 RepID=A0A345T3K2_9ACTN|nr:DUF397 domain-containing protein [Peterkaempfera bronchialis]AXI80557.1 DUF397 domain-containing protein [Peterkaempfera bronchialis]
MSTTPAPALVCAQWRKSSYSNGNGGGCIEIAEQYPGTVPVRDSKDPDGPALVFSAPAFGAFVEAVKSGEFPTLM